MKKGGFTLVELLVTMAILSLLAAVGLGQYQSSQKKARDAQRKADLSNLARALEMYYNDYRSYPLSSDEGKIKVWQGGKEVVLDWGESFEDDESVYMKKIPQDPTNNWSYCYSSDDGQSFSLFAKLENERDPDYRKNCEEGQCFLCGGEGYDFVISSVNISVNCHPCP